MQRQKREDFKGNELKQKLDAVAEKKQEKINEIKEKQQRREERAQRIREKVNF